MIGIIGDPFFYTVAVPAVILVGISKAGFGGGLGALAVPMMALSMPGFQAAAILLPILCAMDLIGCWAYRRDWHRRNLGTMVPGAAIGIGIGTLSVGLLDAEAIDLIIGLIAVVFSLRFFLDSITRTMRAATQPRWLAGSFWAAVSGFTSFLAHAGSPPANVYLLPQRMTIRNYVGTTVVFFAAVNYLKLVPYGWLGQFSANNIGTSLVLMPAVPTGMWLGLKLRDRIAPDLFYKICYGFLLVLGAKLTGDGVGLW